MNRLTIHTNYSDTVLALFTANDFIDNLPNTTISMSPGRLDLPYPDDAISQALAFWFAMAQGCGLVSGYRLWQRWEIEQQVERRNRNELR